MQPWLRVTCELLIARLMDAAPGSQRWPILLALDEFTRLSHIKPRHNIIDRCAE
jgi:type IV secretory pathway TraG/TraD family ATPase VirD4